MARQSKFRQQPKCLIICEDSKSSKDYLQEAINYFRVNSYIEVVHLNCTDPTNIIKKAIEQTKSKDKVFCVIDRDNHPNFDEALALAYKQDQIEIIASYPCYEFWFCLHIGYKRKPYMHAGKKSAADLLIEDLERNQLFSGYRKGGTKGLFSMIIREHRDNYDQAYLHADRILQEVKSDGDKNPSTTLHILLRYLYQLTSPQPIN